MYVKHHNTSFISSWLHRIHLFNFFPFSCKTPMLGGIWDGPYWVSSVRLPLSSVLSEDLCSFLLPGCVLSCFLIVIAVPRVARDVFCPLRYRPACRIKAESEGRHFLKFTVLCFLPSTADASVVPRHASVRVGLGFFFEAYSSRSAVFRLNRLTSGRM